MSTRAYRQGYKDGENELGKTEQPEQAYIQEKEQEIERLEKVSDSVRENQEREPVKNFDPYTGEKLR
ncbi:hypothetical protein [Tetragenococcus muriaticus]|uniref:Uncharacterized protein n=2 Tax=Tetragenococcus muriaticus TaxID=64642 RepID=A0A091C5N2_9ENTE|nr:hypothetical protein [Tetragenococcus muriaticus]KFN91980.1 hypothetical protein TMU3MR103_0702 [Tetragenococcus muriaticus 3MR10-3]KFN92742.1 hypothetical protein TMUPMC115_0758 [Tetragenococcus muriaticus PMC-11-5]